MDWTKVLWRIMCALALVVLVVALTPLWWLLPTAVQAIAVVPGLLVMVLLVLSSFVPSTPSSTSHAASTGG